MFYKLVSNYKLQFLFALIVKLILFYYFIGGYPSIFQNDGLIGLYGGDTLGYITPVDNLLRNGVYYPDERMPGYGFVYLLLRLCFNKIASLNILILLQLIFSALAIVVLVRLSYLLTRNKVFGMILYCSLIVSSYNLMWERFILTDSFCSSALVFLLYFLVRYSNDKHFRFLIFSGLLMTWIIFLRPVFFPVTFIVLFYILFLNFKSSILIKSLLCFLIPIFVIEGSWVIRNYIKHREFIPFIAYDKLIPPRYTELFKFVASYGGDIVYWNPQADIIWFKEKNTNVPAPSIQTSVFSRNDLEEIRSGLFLYDALLPIDSFKATILLDSINNRLVTYTKSIGDEYPYLYHIQSRVILLKKFIFHAGTYNLFPIPFESLSFFQKMVKYAYSIYYVAIITLGFIGILFILLKEKLTINLLLFLTVLMYSVLIFPFLRMAEYRYLAPAFPLIIFCFSYFLYIVCVFFKNAYLKFKSV